MVGWNVKDDYLDHMWLVEAVAGEIDTYRIPNIVSGTYMDLTGSELPRYICKNASY